MALTVKQVNGDASLLLSFEPIVPYPGQQPFRILLDPWITDWKPSSTDQQSRVHTPSLRDLPEPDIVIVSQDKHDHCNEATLKQLASANTKTTILAEPAAAKLIQSWKYFSKDKVITLERWEDPRVAGREKVTRVVVPPHALGGDPGEVTISLIPQKRDFKGLHSSIGITYRPPPSKSLPFHRPVLTPPTTPKSPISEFASRTPEFAPRIPSPPLISSSATTFDTPMLNNFSSLNLPTPPASPPLRSVRSTASLSPHARDRCVSVLFCPHGTAYHDSLAPYATTHLVTEAALPLTALLHPFNAVSHPWWLGGRVSAGVSAGQETAAALGARAWVSTHDGERTDGRGLLAGRLRRTTRYRRDEVRERLRGHGKAAQDTEVFVLRAGEEIALTSEGVWDAGIQPRPSTSSRVL